MVSAATGVLAVLLAAGLGGGWHCSPMAPAGAVEGMLTLAQI